MKILFIYCDTLDEPLYRRVSSKPLFSQQEIYSGSSYISAVLKENGHQTDLFVYSKHTKDEILEQAIREYEPKLICLSAVFREFDTISYLAEYIKGIFPNIYVIAGGPHITLNPEIAIQKCFDAICIGEGEYPILELVNSMEKGKINEEISNFWFKTEHGIVKNPTRAFMEDLDSLPFMDREMWQKWIYANAFHYILLGRGCPFNCTYCSNHALKKVSDGKYVRFRSPSNAIEEIKALREKFQNLTSIYFEVEAINLDMNYLDEFCTQLAAFNETLDEKITYGANYRIIPSQDVAHIFKKFKEANIISINVGLESGNERIRKEIMKRNYSNEDVVRVVETAKENDISIMLYLMVGLPTETEVEFQDTIDLAERCNADVIQLSIFSPYPGTELYKYCLERNYIDTNVKDLGRNVAGLDLPGFSREQIQKKYDEFCKRFGTTAQQIAKKHYLS